MLWQPLSGHMVDMESFCRHLIFLHFLEISFVVKLVTTLCHIEGESFPTCEALFYTKSNLPVLALTMSKGFEIGPHTTEIRGVSNMPRTLRHPV